MLLTELLTHQWLLMLLFFIIAVFYSSVGFGGGSSYLAILALTALSFTEIRSVALLCNIAVVSGNLFNYQRGKWIPWKQVIPLVSTSVPMAFLGGYLPINRSFFYLLLGTTLLLASLAMWYSGSTYNKENYNAPVKQRLVKNSLLGGFIGFLSGMVGIGGGIFLAPLLHLTRWNQPKKIAATASLFIFVNSVSGILGQFSNQRFAIASYQHLWLIFAVVVGGWIGNSCSTKYLSSIQIKRATAVLIALVGLRIISEYLP